jgi:aminoglycoside phosphotransferase (APT) family kinase protein
LAVGVPELAGLPLRINPRLSSSNPLWWSASAVIDERFVVKYAWSEVRAERLWREGVVLERLAARDTSPLIPDLVAVTRSPALVVTRLVGGVPLSWEWASSLGATETRDAGEQLAAFLVRLHGAQNVGPVGDLPVVDPTPQADTARLRDGFPRLLDDRRRSLVLRWCEWVDAVLSIEPVEAREVLVHGDFHGHNQVWDLESLSLRAVVDFEECGIADPNFDLRYLPGNAQTLDLVLAVMHAYERRWGRRLSLERIMVWNVLTTLGDALWRTEAGVELPGGGTAATWVDDLASRLHTLDLG